VPFEARTSTGDAKTMLTTRTGSVATGACPTWVIPNVGGFGYYRYALDAREWTAFAKVLPRQDAATKLGFLANAWAGVKAGTLSPSVLLRLLPAFDGERERAVVDAELSVLAGVERQLVSEAARPAFAKYVTLRTVPHERGLAKLGVAGTEGMTAEEKEKETMLARASLFSAASYLADDPEKLREANEQAAQWLTGRGILSEDAARTVVTLGSRRAGAERIAAIVAAIKDAKDPYARKTAMLALGGFDDEALLDRGLDVLLTDAVASQDVLQVLADAMDHPRARVHAFDWMTRHWDTLKAKLPALDVGYAFSLAEMACTRSEVERVAAFFGPKVDQTEGARRPYDEAIEAATRCAALRESGQPDVDRFFEVRAKAR
jgi:alanyl aminopeptidase